MNRTLVDYYRCPEGFTGCLRQVGALSPERGFFEFGPDVVCFGRLAKGTPGPTVTNGLLDVLQTAVVLPGNVELPFDPGEVVDLLRTERYGGTPRISWFLGSALARNLYYRVRPLLGVSVRRHLQRLRIRGWDSIAFPHWPVDCTVEQLHATLLRLCVQANGEEIPFIWFWPHGKSSCVAVTHDVETKKGRDHCSALMDLDDSFGIKSSFQLIPEERYSLSSEFLDGIKSRGFEVNVHDLNHDGKLFVDQDTFPEKARRINQYGRDFGARGFRSGALYRNLDWCATLEFSYEMSVPNTARMDPQRGGCCTVMPYFLGKLVEIPLTTTQDYSLFHILGDYSTTLWRQQLHIIAENHGIATFNIHPDYVIEPKARKLYFELLQHIEKLRSAGEIWIALPCDVDRWWRNRAQMKIVRQDGEWKIEGEDNERAQLAYARLNGERLEYSWTPTGNTAQLDKSKECSLMPRPVTPITSTT
jgi:hypothetical protein